jgi:uncharacterized linocin/CFP29 family protein
MLATMRRGLQDTEDIQVMSLQDFAQSLPAKFLRSGLNVNVLRSNSLLLKGEWEHLDRRVVQVSAIYLNGILDLQQAGLTIGTGGLGAMISYYQQETDMTNATVNMSPDVDIEEDRIEYPLIGLPVPIIAKAFRLNIRELAANRQHGGGLDTSHIDTATRKVAEMQEQILFNGSSLVIQGNAIYGYTNHPSRNTVAGGDWGTSTNIYPNVLTAVAALDNDGYGGPYKLYLHTDQYNQTLALNANTAKPILQTIQEIPGFGPDSIKKAQTVTAGQGVLISLNSQVVDLAVGQATIPIEWDTRGGMVTRYLVFSCLVPRVKSTAAGKSGVCHLSGI